MEQAQPEQDVLSLAEGKPRDKVFCNACIYVLSAVKVARELTDYAKHTVLDMTTPPTIPSSRHPLEARALSKNTTSKVPSCVGIPSASTSYLAPLNFHQPIRSPMNHIPPLNFPEQLLLCFRRGQVGFEPRLS